MNHQVLVSGIKQIAQLNGPVKASVAVPGSKSLTNRALICAALADGESVIRNASDSEDSALLVNGLNQLGILARKKGSDLIVEGKGGRVFAPKFPVPVGNAGTTLRFLLALSSLADGVVTFEGGGRMSERPVLPLLDALNALGAETDVQEFASRYAVRGGSFNGGSVTVSGTLTSQFLSALMMVSPYAREDIFLNLDHPVVSLSYVSMTINTMKAFGVHVEQVSDTDYRVKAGQRYSPSIIEIEADVSSAACFYGAAAVTGGEVEVRGVSTASVQGDIRILDILKEMGCEITRTENGIRVAGSGELNGVEVNLRATPDLAPVMTAVSLFADGESRITGVPHLKHKESDRLESLSSELRKLGADITSTEDGLLVRPAELTGFRLDPHQDHRLAMSFALIGLAVPGVSIADSECVRKSFPRFWEEFGKLGEKAT